MSYKRKKEKQIYLGLGILCLVVVIICGVILYDFWQAGEKSYELYDDLQMQTEVISTEAEKEAESVTDVTKTDDKLIHLLPDKMVDFQQLEEINKDIYAYIYIPNTNIDYPVLQHPSDDSFYLNHNLDMSKGYPGTIYTEKCNNIDFDDVVTLVYGHNMLNGTMFATLHNFEEKEFFEKNRNVYIYTPEYIIIYDIFAAVTYSDEHIMNTYDFDKKTEFERFMANIYSTNDVNAHFDENIIPTFEDHILVLSTCCSNPDKRYIVCAVRRGMTENRNETEE